MAAGMGVNNFALWQNWMCTMMNCNLRGTNERTGGQQGNSKGGKVFDQAVIQHTGRYFSRVIADALGKGAKVYYLEKQSGSLVAEYPDGHIVTLETKEATLAQLRPQNRARR